MKPLAADKPILAMRERILQQSANLFAERGYDGVSIREIAAACQITKAALYYHFTDKEHLLIEILEAGLESYHQLIVEAIQAETSAPARIQHFVSAIFQRLAPENRALIRLAAQEMGKLQPELRNRFSRRYHQRFLEPLADIFRQGQQRGEVRPVLAELAVWTLLGILYPFLSRESAVRPAVTPAQVETLLDLFWNGVKG
ncbi:MAG: TetR/AcrR family transcriptional regulator [Chloroflexota bacterium]|jgi:AcrR family transcriptional regulator